MRGPAASVAGRHRPRLRWISAVALAILGPPLVLVAIIYASAVGSWLALGAAGALGAAALAAAVLVFARLSRWLGIAALLVSGAVVLALSTFLASPLPRPEPYAGALPTASPPPDMAAFRLPTGRIWRTAAFGYRGGSLVDRREFAMTSVLVKHPRGDLLIDTGFGRSISTQVELLPRVFRAISPLELGRPAAEQLAAAGYDRSHLRGILLTHAHWDHVSGVPDFPDVPVLVTADERRFIDEGGMVTAFARANRATRYEVYDFDGGPYLGFPQSRDLYRDGSIVIVPAPGHTPGSVIVFLALPDGQRFALVGDLVWQREGITEREERPFVTRKLVDFDAGEVRANILRMAAIAERFPEIKLAPAHDPRGLARLPILEPR